jgi:hypothetical protein
MVTSPLLPPLTPRSGPSPFFIRSAAEGEHMFHPHESLAIASRVTMQSAGVGLLVSAVQNALEKYVFVSQLTGVDAVGWG